MSFDVDIGWASERGPRTDMEDFAAARRPAAGESAWGVIAAVADGVSEGGLGKEAAQTTVMGLLRDWYATPATWDPTVALEIADRLRIAPARFIYVGDTSIDMVNDWFQVELPVDDFETIGGMVSHAMGHVPKRGESHALAGLLFMVQHTKGGAVKWFKVMPVPTEP